MTAVLVVDDSPLDQTLVHQLLQSADVTVEVADNGAAALQRIEASSPEVVVTDLMMPEMDGLQLVQAIRSSFPDIPVILMTSRGTEEVAIAGLKAGAASFVPKSRLSDRLVDTLRQVVALKRVDHHYAGLLRCLELSSNTFSLSNDIRLIPQLVDLVQRALASISGCDATESIRLSLALEEGLLNALLHGNLELTQQIRKQGFSSDSDFFKQRTKQTPYQDRRIFVEIEVSPRRVRFMIRDEGPGFDTVSGPATDTFGPFEEGFGRGLTLMRAFMHEVSYNDKGNELTLVKTFD